ncbi:MAG: PepSY-associated TM helix domain-containing protein [Rikenellaceae bacterium]
MSSKTIVKYLRIIHRDLGFLMVGISIIYGVSGMIVNHMGETDPAYKTIQETITIETDLMHSELPAHFESLGLPTIKRTAAIDEDHTRVMLEGGVGVYNSKNGELVYEQHKQRPVIYWFNRLHYSRVTGWSIMADFFAASLIFFAISGVFMVRGKVGVMGRGKWYLILGVLIPIIYVFLSK